jgi:hypothetical protein
MAIINRASLPEEFFDLTSGMLLVQPEPQYVFAQLFKAAIGSAMMLAAANQIGITPARMIPSSGLQYTLPGADRLTLATPDGQASQMILSVAELSRPQVGHTVRVNRPRYGSGGFTLANREITSGSLISTIATDLQSEQVTITVKRYGGPYDPSQAAVAPLALDRFDASRSVHSLAGVIGTHMQRDFDHWADAVCAQFLSSGSTTLWPQGFAADSQSATVGDMPLDCDLLFRGVETLRNANIPMFSNGRYRAFITPTGGRQLQNDAQTGSFIRYDVKGANPITGEGSTAPGPGYIGHITGCDIFEATTLTSAVNGNGIPVYTSFMAGPGMMATGAGALPYVASSTDDNYGESAKVVWLSYLGFNLADARFGVQLHTS